jgi:hypothetical protein
MAKKLKWIVPVLLLLGISGLGGAVFVYYKHKKEKFVIQTSIIKERKTQLDKLTIETENEISLILSEFEKIKKKKGGSLTKLNDLLDHHDKNLQEIKIEIKVDDELKDKEKKLELVLELLRSTKKTVIEWIDEKNAKAEKSGKESERLWEKQKNGNWKKITAVLAEDLEISDEINLFINQFYRKAMKKEGISNSSYFGGFGGFYIKEETEIKKSNSDTMGYCLFEKPFEIWINQAYLLSNWKAGGMNRLIANFSRKEKEGAIITNISSLPVAFTNLVETITHELAHALQFSLRKKSSCKSDLGTEKWNATLAAEFLTLEKKIKIMIEGSNEYREFKMRWEGKK